MTTPFPNQHQRILFVCSANVQRSKTAEVIFAKRFPQLEFDSAGTNHMLCIKAGTKMLTEPLVKWADRVFVMERKHKRLINQYTRDQYTDKLVVLDIPDEFEFMQEELVVL